MSTAVSVQGPSDEHRRLHPNEFRDVIGHFASGVTVITAVQDGRPVGTTASAVCSLSLEPPMLLVCMNRTSTTGNAVGDAGRFAVNILGEDQSALADRFARKGDDKFAGVPTTAGIEGQPLLDDALAQLECRVAEAVRGGTHVVFLAEVLSATAGTGAPLAYFRGQFGRLELRQDQDVYEELRQRVLEGEFRPSEANELLALAELVHAPAGTVYHALGKLTAEGLVTRTPGGAFVVPPLTWPAVRAALAGCRAIELGVVVQAAGRLERAQVEWLSALMERSLVRIVPGRFNDADEAVRAYAAFHEAVVELSGSPALVAAFRRLAFAGIMERTFRPHVATEADAAFGDDHRELVVALVAGDGGAAAAVVTRHYDRFETVLSAALRRAGAS